MEALIDDDRKVCITQMIADKKARMITDGLYKDLTL